MTLIEKIRTFQRRIGNEDRCANAAELYALAALVADLATKVDMQEAALLAMAQALAAAEAKP